MNEYDSARWPTCSPPADGLDADRPRPRTPTSSCSTPARCARRRRSACSTTSAACAQLKAAKPDLVIGVGGCVASQEGAAIVQRAPYVDLVFGPQTLHRLPAADRARAARTGAAQVDISLSRDREVRPPAAAARRGRERLRLDHGRLQQVLHVLRRAVHARRGSLAPVRRRADRGRRPRRPGRRESRCSGRTSTPTAARIGDRRGESADFATAARARRRDSGHRAHPLHDLASEGDDAAADRRLRRVAKLVSHCTCRCSRARTACSRR